MAFREIDESAGRLPSWTGMVRTWLHGLFLEDWWLKLLALAITLGLWWGVTGQRTPATIRIAGVQLNYRLPPQMEISNDPRREVEVTLTGTDRLLQRINSRDLVAYVDLSDNQPGDRVVNLTPERVSMGLPEGVHIDDIEPNTVPLRLEPRVERLVKVEARLEGNVPEGYEVLGFKVMPAEVRVRGPESHVDALQKAPTETILMGGRRETFLANQVAVDVPDQKLNVLDPVVNVTVEIGEKRVEKSFANVTIVTGSGGKARPARADVTLAGPRSVLDNLHSSDIQLTLVSEDNGQVSPRLVLPQGSNGAVDLRSTKPAVFSIIR